MLPSNSTFGGQEIIWKKKKKKIEQSLDLDKIKRNMKFSFH